MIIALAGIKGGTGKTTIATHLAMIYAQKSRDTLLVDADDQGTASLFTALRNQARASGAGYTIVKLSGAQVRTELLRLAPKYEEIVIDVGGRDTASQRAALSVAQVALFPFTPSSFDVWTLQQVGELVAEMQAVNPRLQAFSFLNQATPKGKDNAEAASILREELRLQFIETFIVSRKAFRRAADSGQCVNELKPLDVKAAGEITCLYQQISTSTAQTRAT